jgi:hypothetical protein
MSQELIFIIIVMVLVIFMYFSICGIQMSVHTIFKKLQERNEPQPYTPTLPANLPDNLQPEQPMVNPYANEVSGAYATYNNV